MSGGRSFHWITSWRPVSDTGSPFLWGSVRLGDCQGGLVLRRRCPAALCFEPEPEP